MLLREIFDALTYGELSQLNIGGTDAGFIDDANYDRMLTHMNLGLTALHKRFVIKLNQIELIFLPGVTRYHLHSQHRYSDEEVAVGDFRIDIGDGTLLLDNQPVPDAEYIRDQPYARFQDDLLKIERVKIPEGLELPLNDHGQRFSVFTPKDTVLHVPLTIVDGLNNPDLPKWLRTDRVYIEYRQNHIKLEPGAGEYDANRVEIDLPDAYLQALLYYIASRVYNPLSIDQQISGGNVYYGKYEAECQRLLLENVQIDQSSTHDRICSRGWV